MERRIAWKPHPGPQTKALTCPQGIFEILFGGARGGGKTDAGFAWLVGNYEAENGKPASVAFHARYRGLVIRRNAEDLSDWIDRARMFYQPFKAEVLGKPAVIRFPSGALIRTGHLKDEGAYVKYLGHEYQKILIEELTLIPTQEDYLKLMSSCRSTIPELRPQVFATTNPGGQGHLWVKERFIDFSPPYKPKRDPVTGRHRVFIPAKVSDNPALVKNDPEYVRYLDGLPDDLRRAWRDGDWDVFQGQFFNRFRREIHVVEPFEIPDEWSMAVALDWGYSPHPFSIGWYAQDFEGKVYKYREVLGHEKSPIEVAAIINERSEGENIGIFVGDPSMWIRNPMATAAGSGKAYSDKSVADQISSFGVPLLQANNDRINGWVHMKSLIEWEGKLMETGTYELSKTPKLYYFSTCRESIRDIPLQMHDEKRPGDMLKQAGDDTVDTDRYALMHLFESEKPPEEKRSSKTVYDEHLPGIIWAENETGGGWMDS